MKNKKKISGFYAKKENVIAFVVLVVLIAFWSLSSIFGLIAFFRTNDEGHNNTIVASAESLDGYDAINLYNGDVPSFSGLNASISKNSTGFYLYPTSNLTYFWYFTFYLETLVDSFQYDSDYIYYFVANYNRSTSSTYEVRYTGADGSGLLFPADSRSGEISFRFTPNLTGGMTAISISQTSSSVGSLSFTNVGIYCLPTASQYIPPLEDLDVFENSYNEGYQAGLEEASSGFINGIFTKLNASLSVTYQDYYMSQADYNNEVLSNLTVNPFDYTVTNSFFSFSQVGTYFENNVTYYEYFEKVSWVLSFSNGYPLTRLLGIVGQGVSTSFYNSLTFTFDDGRVLLVPWNLDSLNNTYYLDSSSVNVNAYSTSLVVSISSWFGGSIDGTMFSLIDDANGYYNGIREGYEEGYNNGLDKGYQEGFDADKAQAVADAERAGYNRGLEDGAERSNIYTFERLLSAVIDVPVRAFKSMFNFEILGVNLMNFAFSIMTLCFVLAIVKLIL